MCVLTDKLITSLSRKLVNSSSETEKVHCPGDFLNSWYSDLIVQVTSRWKCSLYRWKSDTISSQAEQSSGKC